MAPHSASRRLHAETASEHEDVDAAFKRFDLTSARDYRRVLGAHAAALVAAEDALAGRLPIAWRPRAALIREDLADLGEAPPEPLRFAIAGDEAAAWGTLYVLEGSRLGNGLLVRSVPDPLPRRYMAAVHQPGEWRALLAAIDVRGTAEGDRWSDAAIAGARACFALYGAAAARIVRA